MSKIEWIYPNEHTKSVEELMAELKRDRPATTALQDRCLEIIGEMEEILKDGDDLRGMIATLEHRRIADNLERDKKLEELRDEIRRIKDFFGMEDTVAGTD
jgi:hypothetical protein